MSKIREEAQKWSTANERSWEQGAIQRQAQRVLLLEKAVRYQRAAMKLRNYAKSNERLDAAWASAWYTGKIDSINWFWWCVDACELNANILWTMATDMIRQSKEE